MRIARTLLATATCALLAACGDAPTAPATPQLPTAPAANETTATGGCVGEIVYEVQPDGSITTRCVLIEGRQLGSGN